MAIGVQFSNCASDFQKEEKNTLLRRVANTTRYTVHLTVNGIHGAQAAFGVGDIRDALVIVILGEVKTGRALSATYLRAGLAHSRYQSMIELKQHQKA